MERRKTSRHSSVTYVERSARAGEVWASMERWCIQSCTSSSISDAASAMNASQARIQKWTTTRYVVVYGKRPRIEGGAGSMVRNIKGKFSKTCEQDNLARHGLRGNITPEEGLVRVRVNKPNEKACLKRGLDYQSRLWMWVSTWSTKLFRKHNFRPHCTD